MSPPELLTRAAAACEPELDRMLADAAVPARLRRAMRYSVLGGGKRLRPAIALGAALACGAGDAIPRLVPAACALELVHSYSLIHDDLPCMDDAELRRGKPACHRAFDESTAVLAGDALQALAFEALARPLAGVEPAARLRAVLDLAEAVGPAGMCGGQALDLAAAHAPEHVDLQRLQAMKTGRLIRAAARVGGHLAGAADTLDALDAYGSHLGAAFQIADDILDVVGSGAAMGKATGGDARDHKVTVVSRFGLAGAREMAARAARSAVEALAAVGPAAEPLRDLAAYAVGRDR